MPRRYSHSETFKYLDSEITLHPETGKFYCPDYNFQADTLQEVKDEIKSHQVKRDKAPKLAVWFRGEGWADAPGKWMLGQTTCHKVAGRFSEYVVVTAKTEKGKFVRKELYAESVYPDTPENEGLIVQITALDTQIMKLKDERRELVEKLAHVEVIEA